MSEKIALVTGASSGIGRCVAEDLNKAGYVVYGTSRQAPDAAWPSSIHHLHLDLAKPGEAARVVDAVIGKHGKIDLLINNAGLGLEPAAAEESSLAQAKLVFDVNFFGLIEITQAVLPHMRSQAKGRIVNVSSALGFMPMPYMALYCASKHALEGYSEALDHEIRGFGVRAVLVEPSYTRTRFDQNAAQADRKIAAYEATRTRLYQHLKGMLEKADPPELVSAVVLEAALAEQPKMRYTAGKGAGFLKVLRHFVPAGLAEKAIRKDLKLDA